MNGKKLYTQTLQLILLGLGIFLCYRFFIGINIDETYTYLKGGQIWPIFIVACVSLITYIFRSLRWNILIESSGEKPPALYHSFSALSFGYLISFFVPRAGELLRCGLLKRNNNYSFSLLLGTVIIERLTDILVLLIILILTFISANDVIIQFCSENIYTPIIQKSQSLDISQLVVIASILIIVGFILIKYILPKLNSRINSIYIDAKTGVTSIVHLKKPIRFIAYTLGIWFCYFLMTWLWFFMFPETAQIQLGMVFFIFVIGTIGRSIPIQGGGAGAYHFLVLQAFLLCGQTSITGQSMAIIIHGGQTAFTLLSAMISLPIFFLKPVRQESQN